MKPIKIGISGDLDLLKFKNLPEERRKSINEASSRPLKNDFMTDKIARILHPSILYVRIKNIILETDDTKTFVLEPNLDKGTKGFPVFQAGQYLTIDVNIGEAFFHRAYTISCSPKNALSGIYQITIKKIPNGIVSNYFFQDVKIGDEFVCHGPSGFFTYNSIRDASDILGIVGGCGITPLYSLANAIQDGIYDINLTILYGAKTTNDFIFKDSLDEIVKLCPKIQVIYITSEETIEGYVNGYITKDIILKYKKDMMSYYLCGPVSMYESLNVIFKDLKVANKYIRHDLYPEFQPSTSKETFILTVVTNNEEIKIECRGNETLLSSMERNGIASFSKCGVGVCGFCRSKLIFGDVLTDYTYVRKADKKYHYIHPCCSYPLSNVKIKLPK